MARPMRQQGVAVVTALLLTTLAVTIVASLFWQQQVQVRSMENQRLQLQTRWIVRGALDWARLVLVQDGFDNRLRTTLNDVWNTPLAETRLDQYIERERADNEKFDATLSGRIIDATSRYNLRNLAKARVPAPDQVAIFQRLLTNLQLDPSLAERAALAVAGGQLASVPPVGQNGQPQPPPAGMVPKSPSSEPMEVAQLEDLLAVDGFTPQVVARLRDFAIVLPEPAPVNVNTASAEVLAAVAGVSISEGNALVAARKTAYWPTPAQFDAALQAMNVAKPPSGTYDVKSEYFLVQSYVKLDRANLSTEALINRKLNPFVTASLVAIRQN